MGKSRRSNSAYLGYFATEAVPESFAGRAPRVARGLVGPGQQEEGVCAPPGDVTLARQAEGAVRAASSAGQRNDDARVPASKPVAEIASRGQRDPAGIY